MTRPPLNALIAAEMRQIGERREARAQAAPLGLPSAEGRAMKRLRTQLFHYGSRHFLSSVTMLKSDTFPWNIGVVVRAIDLANGEIVHWNLSHVPVNKEEPQVPGQQTPEWVLPFVRELLIVYRSETDLEEYCHEATLQLLEEGWLANLVRETLPTLVIRHEGEAERILQIFERQYPRVEASAYRHLSNLEHIEARLVKRRQEYWEWLKNGPAF